jgi:hypothetical protein
VDGAGTPHPAREGGAAPPSRSLPSAPGPRLEGRGRDPRATTVEHGAVTTGHAADDPWIQLLLPAPRPGDWPAAGDGPGFTLVGRVWGPAAPAVPMLC